MFVPAAASLAISLALKVLLASISLDLFLDPFGLLSFFNDKLCSYVENLYLLYCAFTFCLRIKDTINKSDKTRANHGHGHGRPNPNHCLLVDFLHMKLIVEQTPGMLIINRPGAVGAVPELHKYGNTPV